LKFAPLQTATRRVR